MAAARHGTGDALPLVVLRAGPSEHDASILFEIYTRMQRRTPSRVWSGARWTGLLGMVGMIVAALAYPRLALPLFWNVLVPVLPLLLLVAPGLWRNSCPIALVNQLPRAWRRSRGIPLPVRFQRYSPWIAVGLFILIVPGRSLVLDHQGTALAAFLLGVLLLSFLGGLLFRGKSGWCSQFCPMLPLERLYGQSPLQVVRNDQCATCSACVTNCYDFNPTAAYLADLHDNEPSVALCLKMFAGAMPWLIVAFFTQPALREVTASDVALVYGRVLLAVFAGVGLFLAAERVAGLGSYRAVLGHVVAAINLFYWFTVPMLLDAAGLDAVPLTLAMRAGVAAVSLDWLLRAMPRERIFQQANLRRVRQGYVRRRAA